MSNRFFIAAFAVGLLALAAVGYSFLATSWLAFAMTLVIAAVYLAGAHELRQFRAATATLRAALDGVQQTPAALADWLEGVPATLRNTVKARIEGDRAALPGPTLTPYLVGLLVMLGMLGTFLGMVVTFKGAVFALQGSTDLQAIRAALAEPIRGLGLSFGTSVAGVAASAMLGLMSAIARRERLDVARLLDARIAGTLQPFSLAHHRQETLRAMQEQIRTLPEVALALHGVMERIERRSEQLDTQLLERHAKLQQELTGSQARLQRELVEAQARLQQELAGAQARLQEELAGSQSRLQQELAGAHTQLQKDMAGVHTQLHHELTGAHAQLQREVTGAYSGLVQQVGASLQENLAANARTTADTVKPIVEQTMARVAQESERIQQRLGEVAQQQVAALREEVARVVAGSHALQQRIGDVAQAQVDAQAQRLAAAEERQAAAWTTALATLRQDEAARGESAVQRIAELEAAVAQHLATLGAALEAPITRLLHTASEVPQAAAGVITQLREEMNRVAERDNLALQERTLLLERLGALVGSLEQAAGEQRTAIEAMVGSATSVLEQSHQRFAQALDAEAAKSTDVSAHVAASAVELTAVAEAFGESVRLFQASHEKLTDTLQRVEASLQKSTARSDEQLAYYVAQAREVIDLSIASQQGLVDSLRQLQGKSRSAPVEESIA